MTVLTVITVPELEQGEGVTPKILEAFNLKQLREFTSYPGALDGHASFEGWLEAFLSNNLFVVVVDSDDEIRGCITAKNSQEEILDDGVNRSPLLVTGFYSNPREKVREEGVVEVLVEAAVLTGCHHINIPNTTELMRNLTNQILFNQTFDEVEIILTGDIDHDCFDISNFKTYKERASA